MRARLNRPISGVGSSTSMIARSVAEVVLLDRCVDGDTLAWATLISLYELSIYKFAYSLCRNHDEAEDITALVFLRLYQNLSTFRYEASFTSWLFRIVRNTYLDMCVRPPGRNNLSLDAAINADDDASREIVDPAPSPEQECLSNETAMVLASAIQHLPAYQRQVLRLYHTDGKSYEEIALLTGLSIGTVKSRLNRARSMLRERLAPHRDILIAA